MSVRNDHSAPTWGVVNEEVVGMPAVACVGIGKEFRALTGSDCWRLLVGSAEDVGCKDTVLEDVHFSVRCGTFVGIMGANGAGKSTLLRVIGGILNATAGFVDVSGELTGLYELGPLGDDRLSGREYARRYLSFQDMGKQPIDEAVDWIWNFSELGDYFDLPIYTYSSGMKARLFFSVATVLPRDIYLVDEAMSVGDEYFTSKCWRHMRRQIAQGAAGIYVSQSWDSILSFCTEMHVMDKGRIVQSGPVEELVPALLPVQKLHTEIAHFHESLGDRFTAVNGEDVEFIFPVVASMSRTVRFVISVDVFRPGFGWILLLLQGRNYIELVPGRNDIRVSIPAFPLAPGKYAMNIALSDAYDESDRRGAKVMLDNRNWSLGNQLQLDVAGDTKSNAAVLAVKWKLKESA
ncbi:MAG: ABC transporter ATP-binding protein [Rhodospirillales bacterium]